MVCNPVNGVECGRRLAQVLEDLIEARFGYPRNQWDEGLRTWYQVLIQAQGRQSGKYLRAIVCTADRALPLRVLALALLLAPTPEWAPFLTEGQRRVLPRSFLCGQVGIPLLDIKSVCPELFDVYCTLLAYYPDVVLLDQSGTYAETLNYYNIRILEVLRLLPENDPRAAMLFERYQLNDPLPFMTRELCDLHTSGYNPLYLLWSAGIPSVWKEHADKAMRGRILKEERDGARPRMPWERALSHYVSWIEQCVLLLGPGYGKAFLESQVRFVLDLTKDWEVPCFHDWHVPHIWDMLTDTAVRHQFARRVLLARGSDDLFPVRDAIARTFIASVLTEFPKDEDIATRACATIAEQDKRAARIAHAVWV